MYAYTYMYIYSHNSCIESAPCTDPASAAHHDIHTHIHAYTCIHTHIRFVWRVSTPL